MGELQVQSVGLSGGMPVIESDDPIPGLEVESVYIPGPRGFEDVDRAVAAASGFATSAGGSAVSAADSATAAAGSAVSAAESASEAGGSAVSAGNSATAAAGSAVSAAESASEAGGSAVSAGNSASLALAALTAVGAGQNLSVTTEPLYVNGSQVMFAVVDTAGRALAYLGMDGSLYGKLPITPSNGISFVRQSDGSYTLKLDPAIIDTNYIATDYDYLAAIVDSASRTLFSLARDGTLNAKLGLSASNGFTVTRQSDGSYLLSIDPNYIDRAYYVTDYLCAIVDSNGRILFGIGIDGSITGKITIAELITARGNRAALDDRVSQYHTPYGLPKRYTYGEWYLRETRMRLRKRTMAESVQLVAALIGDSWTHLATRYSYPVASSLKTSFGDAGPGWTGFSWGGGGASNVWSSGNGNVNSSEVAVTLTTGWAAAYYTTASPDIGGISTATAGSRASVTFSGSGNVSAVNLFYTAGSGVLRYRWNGGSWTTLDISTGSGTAVAALASVPTGTWTLDIENVSGTTVIHGVDVQKTTDGVRVHKLGSTGSSSANWSSVDATNWQAALTGLAPNLVTILLGTNDKAASMLPATYRANLQTMITRIRAALPVADIAIIMPCENQRVGDAYSMTSYAQQAYEIAAINNCAFLDLQYVFGDTAAQYAYGSARPWFASDLIHPDPTTGGRAITDAVYRLLTNV